MDDIYLTAKEKRLLRKLRLKRQVAPRFDISKLLEYGLIVVANPRSAENGKPLVVSISDRGIRFCIARREGRFKRVITPIIVTVLTNIVLYGLQWLLGLLWPTL